MSVLNSTVPSVAAGRFNLWMVRGFVTILGLYVLYMNLLSPFNPDELEGVHSAWLILQGKLIYVDFFQHHHPLLYSYLVPIITLLGEHAGTVIACRIAIMPFFAGILAASYLLALRLFDKPTALVAIACLLLSWPFLYAATSIRPDVPQVMFGMIALLMLYPRRAPQGGKPPHVSMWRYLLAGLCLGLSFLFLQKAIFYVAVVTLVLLGRILRREAGWKVLFTMAGGMVIAIFPFAIWLAAHGMTGEYFFLNWTLNAYCHDRFSFVSFAIVVLESQPVMCAFALLAFIALVRDRRHAELTVMLMGLLCQVLLAPSPYLHYWLPVLPLLAIYAGHGLMRTLGPRPAIIGGLLAASLIAPIITNICAAYVVGGLTNLERLDQIAYVLKVTSPSDTACDPYVIFNVFRKDVDYFWFSLDDKHMLATYKRLRPYELDIYDRIDKMKPKAVSTFGIENLDDARIRDHYVKSDRFPTILIRNR